MKVQTKYIKLIIFIIAIIAVIIINHHYKLHDKIHNLDDFKYMIGDNIVKASIIYIVITAIGSSILALPGVTFALFSGILFGPILGIILCSVSSTLAAVISFLVSRFFLKDTIKPLIEKNKYLNKLLFQDGNKNANVMLIGEGPGADEDKQGVPFVGKAGQLMNKAFEGLGIDRKKLYIANIVKCRPPNNRVPEEDE